MKGDPNVNVLFVAPNYFSRFESFPIRSSRITNKTRRFEGRDIGSSKSVADLCVFPSLRGTNTINEAHRKKPHFVFHEIGWRFTVED